MSDSLDGEIRSLRAQFWSSRDPEGMAFAPLAEAYRKKGELAEASSLLQDGLGRLPDFTPGHLIASRVARDRGELLAAREHLDRVLDLDPHNAAALLERAALRRGEGDSEGAIVDLLNLLELEPDHEEARATLARLESEGEAGFLVIGVPETLLAADVVPDAELVALDFEEVTAEESEGEGSESTFLLTRTMGELYAKQGLHLRAVEVYDQLLVLSPADPELLRRASELREYLAMRGTAEEERPIPSVGSPAATASPEQVGRTIGQYLEDLLAWVPEAVPIASLAPDAPAADDDLQDGIRSPRQ